MSKTFTHGNWAELLYGEGTAKEVLARNQITYDCIVTSPPYFGLRNYCDNPDQTGQGQTLEEYIDDIVSTMNEARKHLSDEGTLWLNIGDSYATRSPHRSKLRGETSGRLEANSKIERRTVPDGLKEKDLIGVPWRIALRLQADGWWLRNDIIWSKPNPMPSGALDRCTPSHEYVFMFSKKRSYYFDIDAIRTPYAKNTKTRDRFHPDGALPRTVWGIRTSAFKGAHYAVFPEELALKCILAGCPAGGTVLDPFSGSATCGKVAIEAHRNYFGIDVNEEYLKLANERIQAGADELDNAHRQLGLFGGAV
jgi:site-specific DNA-methyltransferase (adenine-specific)/site-specific DNA-methyltransferase (cytosine-N4-specific)